MEDSLDRAATPEEIEMVERLLKRIRPAQVLDPSCGSGSSIRAAMAEGAAHALGLEIDPDFASRARLALDEANKDNK